MNDVLIYLIIGLVVLVIGGSWILQIIIAYVRTKENWRQAVQRGKRIQAARMVAAGHKPWGKPLAESIYGNSYFLSTEQIVARGYGDSEMKLKGDAPFIGHHGTGIDGKLTAESPIQFPRDGHLLTVAPTRAGKGVSQIIPNLLIYEGSVVVIDIKGENDAITSRWRERAFGEVYPFDPFSDDGLTAHFNPMDFIRENSDALEDAQLIAEMLVPPSDIADAEFWDGEARAHITGIILHVALSRQGRKRTLAEVRHILTLGDSSFLEVIEEMGQSTHRAVQRASNAYLSMEPKLRSNVRATVRNRTHFLDSARLENAMAHSDWTFEELKERCISVYLIIPPDRLGSYWPLLRLVVGLATSAMSRNKTPPEIPVLFMLDEFTQLGRMDRLAASIRYLAGYGVRLWFFVQDLSSLRSVYGQAAADSIIANCSCRSFFGTADYETARYISDFSGDMTIAIENLGSSVDTDDLTKENASQSVSFGGKRLLSPEEVLQFPADEMLIFIRGERPIWGGLVPYFQKDFFRQRASQIVRVRPDAISGTAQAD